MTPAELPAMFEGLAERVRASAVPVVDAITDTYKGHVKDVTLLESGSHPPVTQTPAPEGRPPALMPDGVNGSLRDSIFQIPGVGIGDAVAEGGVSPDVIYAGVQEFGSVHFGKPLMWLWVRYIGPVNVKKAGWVKERVDIPARPYMSTAVNESIANGSLERAAIERFTAVMWG